MKCKDCRYYKIGISAAKTVNHDFDSCYASPDVVKIPNREIICRFFEDISHGAKNTEQPTSEEEE